MAIPTMHSIPPQTSIWLARFVRRAEFIECVSIPAGSLTRPLAARTMTTELTTEEVWVGILRHGVAAEPL